MHLKCRANFLRFDAIFYKCKYKTVAIKIKFHQTIHDKKKPNPSTFNSKQPVNDLKW